MGKHEAIGSRRRYVIELGPKALYIFRNMVPSCPRSAHLFSDLRWYSSWDWTISQFYDIIIY